MALEVKPVEPVSTKAWHLVVDKKADWIEGFEVITKAGYTALSKTYPVPDSETNEIVWEWTLSLPGHAVQTGHSGDWIVYDGMFATIYKDEDFKLKYQT